ncbi:MAG: hydratase [Candidatus Competibacteraceae bacterium]
MHALARYGWIGLLVLVSMGADAACPNQAAVAAYVVDFRAARPSQGFGADLTLADAKCARGRLVRKLSPVLGRVVGYKAAFTNPAMRARFGVKEPAWGAMFEKTLAGSGATLPARFGAYPQYEADLIVVVKDAGLVDAKTPLEALRHLSAVIPFIELPDRMLEGPLTGVGLVATNVGFRAGVLGRPMPVEPTQAFVDTLANMTVVMTDSRGGQELGRASGSTLMNHPLNAALWLAQALKQDGIALKPGDLLSLGGYFPPAPTRPGTSIMVQYRGLPGDPSVTVRFE